ncbi:MULTISPECIES: flagellar basal-body MS-ring/collar protein FliF [Ferrimonas]|uniref:flagellar basal-body MS-ring/collar protein FliF n=1 Tax=Ferrimonas TaxID=44011 RepID=UPI0004090BF8|nr:MULTISPECIES: flagellar basal-body MS-ring/collar protein FliF [Ferrimonas]USD36271.1 flagellar M-ring protein FliF [Ferrimonas sp. SCSIO 43195]
MSTVITQNPDASVASPWDGIKGGWNKLSQSSGGEKQVIVVSILAVVAAMVIVMVLWSSSTSYRPLYGNQEGFDSAQIIEVLETEGLNYQISPTTGQILVESSRVGAVRMLLAAKGIKAQLPSGLDDINSDITSSQFMEQARYRHGLEGELSRTIMALDAVRVARVHLAIPKRTLFIRKQDTQASASVMIDLEPGQNLTSAQVTAVVNLVAGSVAGLDATKVQLVNQYGELLSGNDAAGNGINGLSDLQVQYTQSLEQQLIARAEAMLLPVLGPSQFRVQVAAKVNFDQVEETEESVDPTSVIREEKTSSMQNSGSMALGIPGALSNQPPQPDGQEKQNVSTNLTEEASRSFDVGRSVRHTKYQQAQLQQLSVSVLVNEEVANGSQWQQAQLQQMGQMVKDAIGFDQVRGDSFSLTVFPFAVVTATPVEPLPWWQMPEYQQYLRYLLGALVALCLIFFVLRPLVGHLIKVEKLPAYVPPVADEPLPELEPPVEQKEDSKGLASAIVALGLPEPGSPLTVQLEHLGLLANEEPARVAEVIGKWIGADKRD